MEKEFEIILKTLANKIDSLECDARYKQWKIDELTKENEALKNVEKRPLVEPKEVETR